MATQQAPTLNWLGTLSNETGINFEGLGNAWLAQKLDLDQEDMGGDRNIPDNVDVKRLEGQHPTAAAAAINGGGGLSGILANLQAWQWAGLAIAGGLGLLLVLRR